MTEKNVSVRLSMEGYSVKKALYRNKEAVKAVLSVVVGVNYVAGFDLKTVGVSLATAILALGSKLVWDAFDYYFSEVIIE